VFAIDPYELRHLLCALIGICGIGATAATARLIAGPRAGLIAAVALAVCGSWYGGMFNHTKDIPLAAAMTGATYFLIRASRDLPNPRRRDVLAFGQLTGTALGIKVLGLLLLVYICAAIVMRVPRPILREPTRRLHFALRAVYSGTVDRLTLMIAAWPWARLAPLNPIRGLISFADFHYHIHTRACRHCVRNGDRASLVRTDLCVHQIAAAYVVRCCACDCANGLSAPLWRRDE
jgi:hypothetical protein